MHTVREFLGVDRDAAVGIARWQLDTVPRPANFTPNSRNVQQKSPKMYLFFDVKMAKKRAAFEDAIRVSFRASGPAVVQQDVLVPGRFQR